MGIYISGTTFIILLQNEVSNGLRSGLEVVIFTQNDLPSLTHPRTFNLLHSLRILRKKPLKNDSCMQVISYVTIS